MDAELEPAPGDPVSAHPVAETEARGEGEGDFDRSLDLPAVKALVRALPDLIFRIDAQDRITAYSAGRTEDLYARPAAFLGRTLSEVLPPEVAALLQRAIGLARVTGGVEACEYRLATPAGDSWFEARNVPFVDGAGEVLTVVRNVTARKQAEHALLQSEVRLRASEKMEAVGRLAGGIAHDFNNLLMVVLTHCDLVARRLGAGLPIEDDIAEIREAGERAASLTKQLLAFSRRQVQLLRVLDLNDVIEDMRGLLARLIGEDIALDIRLAERLWAVEADRSQVEQVLLNLALNARDAMPAGGLLRIETDDVEVSLDEARGREGARAGEHVRLRVRDAGVGMDEVTLAHIFEPFFSTKDRGSGAGLGLSTVYGIVRQSGGHLVVTSEPGAGTTFAVHLPRATAPLAAPAPQGAASPERGGHETVLVVEDDRGVRKPVVELLSILGYRVLEAAGAEAALALARAHEGPIALLLTDVVMPGVSGPELAASLRATRPEARVLYMSGYAADAAQAEGKLASVELMHKPFSASDLARRVREVLDLPDGGA